MDMISSFLIKSFDFSHEVFVHLKCLYVLLLLKITIFLVETIIFTDILFVSVREEKILMTILNISIEICFFTRFLMLVN